MTPAPNSVVLEAPTTTPAAGSNESASVADGAAVLEELLVEEISIDGMCGVY